MNISKSALAFCVFFITAIIPQAAFAVCASPAGVDGEMEYNTGTNQYEYCNDTDWKTFNTTNIGACTNAGEMEYNSVNKKYRFCNGTDLLEIECASTFTTHGVTFDGSSDYLSNTANLTGVVDSKLVSGSLWIKTTQTPAGAELAGILGMSGPLFAVLLNSSGNIYILGKAPSTTTILEMTSSIVVNDDAWHHILFSADMANPSNRHLYIDGANVLSGAPSTHLDSVIDFTTSSMVGGGALRYNGDMSEVWIDHGTYIDFSILANRQDFYDSSSAVNLGADGSIPTGAVPSLFLGGTTTTGWETNKGSGGGYTENGTLTDATTAPPFVTTCFSTEGVCTKTGETTMTNGKFTYCDGDNYIVIAN